MANKKKSSEQTERVESVPLSFETFRPMEHYDQVQYQQSKPSVFNRSVRIRKYRITIELIDEPVEVLADRLQSLWDFETNWQQKDALLKSASSIGYELKGDMGNKAKPEPKRKSIFTPG